VDESRELNRHFPGGMGTFDKTPHSGEHSFGKSVRCNRSRVSSVSIAMSYGLDGLGSTPSMA
jgi:hypothetical protein